MDTCLGLCVVIICLLFEDVVPQHTGIVREYCMETFHPQCSDRAVIVMSQAAYGRMRTGRCMKRDFGLESCSRDELQYMDELCSGRKSCELFVPSPLLAAKQSCLEDLTSYLEASYYCQEVYVPRRKQCISPEKLTVHTKPSYLASSVSSSTQCGLHESPWILTAETGQQVAVELLDFSWKQKNNSAVGAASCVHKYGYLLDMLNDDVINICGGGTKRKLVYQSMGNSVQIVLEAASLHSHHFLLQYKALGCPEYEPPAHSSIQSVNNSLVITCNHGDHQWKVRCLDNIWLGIVGECEAPPKIEEVTVKVKVKAVKQENKSITRKSALPEVSSNHVAAFGLGCATVIVCCSIVFLGMYCTKRYEAKTLQKIKSTQQLPTFLDGTTLQPIRSSVTMQQPMRGSVTYRPIGESTTLDLPPYTSPQPKSQRPPKVPKRNSSMADAMITSTTSDYLEPQNEAGTEEVQYYILENPSELLGNMSEEMYQSIHLHNSLGSN